MTRYFFDIRDSTGLYPDEEGTELLDDKAARVEAAQTLAEIARDTAAQTGGYPIAIEVRSDAGPLFHAAFIVHEVKE
ncbi:DUF6894 family protein [Bradyrhizobium sp. USDA 3364]